jgi:glycosyltransferase involved in cell wall biosynthesis
MKNKKNVGNNKNLKLSIVIPVYNEKDNILKTLDEIKKYILVNHEIIIVYDFDQDTTLTVLKTVKKKNLFVIKNTISRGPSGAIRTGMAKAKSPLILVTMADLCDDLSQVNALLKLVSGNADIVCPSRYMKGGKQQLKGSLKVWAPRCAGYLLKLLAGIPTHDPTNSFKLYSKKVLDSINLKSTISFSVTLEIIVKAHALGYKIVEIPTVWRDRQQGKTNFKLGQSLVAYFPWFLYALLHRRLFR